jgi:hypothetical protein
MECADALTLDLLDRDLDLSEPECGRNVAQSIEIGSGVEQPGQEHVAR